MNMLATIVFTATILPLGVLGYSVPRDEHAWQAPGPKDRRCPCPFVNTMANHGFIPRDGFNVSHQQIFDGFKAGVNFESSALLAAVTLAQETSTTGNPTTFHLDDLNTHNIFEHDASLSRNDTHFGPAVKLEISVWNTTLAHFTEPYISVPQAKAAMLARIATSNATNPDFFFGPIQHSVVDIETAAYNLATGGTVNGGANRAWVDAIFQEERLPYHLGYEMSGVPITGAMIDEYIKNLQAATPVSM